MPLEIIADPLYGIRHFESSLVVVNPDYSSGFSSDGTNFPVGYDFTDSLQGWVKSASNAITTEIKTNGSYTWLDFEQYGYQGGGLTRTYPEILNNIYIYLFLPQYIKTGFSGEVGFRFRTATETAVESAVKIVIDRNSIEVFEFASGFYSSVQVVDTSANPTGADVNISYDKPSGIITIDVNGTLTNANLSITPDIEVVEIYTTNPNDYPLTMQIFNIDAFGLQTKDLNLAVPFQLAPEYLAGDVLIVSVHEGSDYGGSSILPRISGQFEPITTTRLVSPDSLGYQRFWARTLTASEPSQYQFTRGDSESYYDSPTCVGFIVRGGILEDLTITFADAVTGTTSYPLTINSNSCGAEVGDLVFGYAENNDSSQLYDAVPSPDFLWYKPSPHGVTSLREAISGDDGIATFSLLLNATVPYNVFSARISAQTPPQTIRLGDTHYQPWADFADLPEEQPVNTAPRVQTSDNPYAPWSLLEEAPELTEPISGTRTQSKNSSYAPWSYLEDVPPEPELPTVMRTNTVSAQLFAATDLLEADGLYERAQMNVAPDWMLNGYARAFIRASGALKDDLAELLLGAAFISMTVGADRDTLERKARDRALFVIPLEPLEVLRERVSNAFDVLDMAGTLPGLEKALFDAGWNTRIIELYTQMPTDDWDETDVDVWDETTLEVWDGGEAQMFIVFVWQRIPAPLVVQQLPILIQQFKSAESLLKALYQLPSNWDDTTPLPWESAGTLIYGV